MSTAAAILKGKLVDVIRACLRDTWHCHRVWEAWNVATMSEDDFSPVDESDTPDEVAAAVLALLPQHDASAKVIAWIRDQRDGYEGPETLDPMWVTGPRDPGRGINGATYSPLAVPGAQAAVHTQRLQGVLAAVQAYMPPDGVDARETLSTISKLVDPWPDAAPAINVQLIKALESFLRAPSVGSAGPGSSTIVVQDFNMRAASAAIAAANKLQQ